MGFLGARAANPVGQSVDSRVPWGPVVDRGLQPSEFEHDPRVPRGFGRGTVGQIPFRRGCADRGASDVVGTLLERAVAEYLVDELAGRDGDAIAGLLDVALP